MRRRNEYEVTVEPNGKWQIRHIIDDRSRQVSSGSEEGPNCMQLAEDRARGWIDNEHKKLEESLSYRERCKVFTIPTTIHVPDRPQGIRTKAMR